MNFLEHLQTEILIGDGAIGTMLYAKGVSLEANFEQLNLIRPALVEELHAEYLAAGAQVIETNTFGANHTKLDAAGLAQKVREINLQGAILARKAVKGQNAWVAGSVGPLSRIKGEEREPAPDDVAAIFREQTLALAEGGVDLFTLETFADLGQLKIALAVALETGLPVLASMAFLEGGRTGGGVEA
ncbi:MAG: homocysteine S-methyltransferase family protein, partial [Geobacteraceae bacterium]